MHFRPIAGKKWKKNAKKIITILSSNAPEKIKKLQLHPGYIYIKILLFPIFLLTRMTVFLFSNREDSQSESIEKESQDSGDISEQE